MSRSRLLALGLLALVVGGVVVALVGPLWATFRDNREQILQLQEHKDRYRRLAASIDLLQA